MGWKWAWHGDAAVSAAAAARPCARPADAPVMAAVSTHAPGTSQTAPRTTADKQQHQLLNTHTHTQVCNGPLSATTRVGRRNIHPLTPILFIRHSLSTSSIYYDPQHPPCLLGNSHVARCRSQKVPKQHFKQFQSSKQCTGGFMVPTDSQGITSYISVFQQNRWNCCWVISHQQTAITNNKQNDSMSCSH